MTLNTLQTVCHEISLVIGMAAWLLVSEYIDRYFHLPGTIPFNLTYSFTTTLANNPDDFMHNRPFTWTSLSIRIGTDLGIMGIGYLSYCAILWSCNANAFKEPDSIAILKKSKLDRCCLYSPVIVFLFYSTELLLLGAYRLAWNVVCIPFVAAFSWVMIQLFPKKDGD